MKRPVLVLVIAGAVGVLSLAIVLAPRGLRRLEMFDVSRVEVQGTRYLAAEDVVAALRLEPGASVFDDPAPWLAALLEHPLVAEAKIERRPLATLVVQVTEKDPIAFAATPAVLPVAADGTVLPIDLVGADLDLPVLLGVALDSADDGEVETLATREAVLTLSHVRSLAPDLYARISDAEPASGGGMLLRLREPTGISALVPATPERRDLEQLSLALDDLAASGSLGDVRLVDARFRDQVVVSWSQGARR
ncbi:MAG TPA: FtsQ-type POTRA domain-containing protein [Longimicrobiales bacterium]|nr:FtsQ-type POTRA domain-containing protein [Longimicrobiales bacterium]